MDSVIPSNRLTPMHVDPVYDTTENMAISSGTSVRTVKSALYKFRDADLIHRVGSDKKGTWELAQKPTYSANK